jgi:TfoX/Sxy family transcriptional regulator of competence genes
MAYDEALAERMRGQLSGVDGLTERKMFGGLGFMVGGNMACGISSTGGVMVRIGPDDLDQALANGATQMMMRDRPMTGFLEAPAAAAEGDDAVLAEWVARGVATARALPAK